MEPEKSVTQLRDGVDGIFVSASVKESAERVMALIADLAANGGGIMPLTFTETLMRRSYIAELKSRQPARYEIRFSLTAMPTPFLVYDRAKHAVSRRYAMLKHATRWYPDAEITYAAEEAAINMAE